MSENTYRSVEPVLIKGKSMPERVGGWIKDNVGVLISMLTVVFFAGATYYRIGEFDDKMAQTRAELARTREKQELDHEVLLNMAADIRMIRFRIDTMTFVGPIKP